MKFRLYKGYQLCKNGSSVFYTVLCVVVTVLCVVVTLSFNAKMNLANFECNLKTRDSQKWSRKGDLSLWECRGSGPETR